MNTHVQLAAGEREIEPDQPAVRAGYADAARAAGAAIAEERHSDRAVAELWALATGR